LASSFPKVGKIFSNKKMAFPILFEWGGRSEGFLKEGMVASPWPVPNVPASSLTFPAPALTCPARPLTTLPPPANDAASGSAEPAIVQNKV
jgi:hypothetical protein